MLRARATVLTTVLTTLGTTVAAAVLGVLSGAAGVLTAPAAHAAACPRAGGAAVRAAAAPQAEVVFSGHGWGHGMGMSQYGAQGAARLGCSYRTILGTYYRDTTVQRTAMSAPVRLALLTGAAKATVLAENGTVAWPGAVQPKGQTWTVVRRGNGVGVRDATGTERAWVKDATALTASHSGTVVRIRSYRAGAAKPSSDLRTRYDQARFTGSAGRIGVVEQIVTSGGTTAVQKYLWGLAEVPSSWPAEALKAQVVAARTYLTAKVRNGAYELATTTADQVYRGFDKEASDTKGAWRAAVQATKGQVIVDAAGRPVTAMYSSSMGGFTEDRQYVYGRYGISYLKAVDDSRWDLASDNPYRSWVVGFSKRQLAAKLGFQSVTSASIAARGATGRLAGLRVTGVKGGRPVTETFTGATVRYRLKLRSPGFTLAPGATAPAPTPVQPKAPLPPAPAPAVPAQAITGDWDGNGRAEVGWYDNGTVSVRIGGTPHVFRFGTRGDSVVVGDWDGDGRDGLAVFRAGRWFLRNALTTGVADTQFAYGRAGDVPVAGRWDGGTADGVGVVRDGSWYLRRTATGGVAERWFPWDLDGTPVTGDWNSDGRDDPGVRVWNVFTLGVAGTGAGALAAPAVVARVPFGSGTNQGLAADWDDDGADTPGVAQGDSFAFRNDFAGGNALGRITFARP